MAGMYHARDGAQSDTTDHSDRKFVDHISRVTSDDGCADNPVGVFLDMNPDEPGDLTLGQCAVVTNPAVPAPTITMLYRPDGVGFFQSAGWTLARSFSLCSSMGPRPALSIMRYLL